MSTKFGNTITVAAPGFLMIPFIGRVMHGTSFTANACASGTPWIRG